MAVTSTTNIANDLLRRYNRQDWFAPFERAMTPFLDSMKDLKEHEALGAGSYFRLWVNDAHATGFGPQGMSLPATGQPGYLQGNVQVVEIGAAFSINEYVLSVARGDGVFGKSELANHVKMTTRNFMTNLNRAFVAGHGTGRLCTVEADTSSSTQFVAALPESIFQLRRGMKIDFYDTDSGGSKQGNTVSISHINIATRTVTISAAASLTATWGVYQSRNAVGSGTDSTYGYGPNGMRNIVDDGTLAATYCGLTRATYPRLNAQIITGGVALQPYSEKLIREGINQAYLDGGAPIEELWCNEGIISEHYNHTIPDRMYTVDSGGAIPKYKVGGNRKDISFNWNGKEIPFKCDGDMPARELFGLTKSQWHRNYARKPSWIGDGTGEGGSAQPVMMQLPGTSNYTTSKIAGMLAHVQCCHLAPWGQVKWPNIADEELGGDTVPTA